MPSGGVRIKGSLSIDDVNDQLPIDLPEGDYDTVSGLVLAGLGRMAVAGDAVEVPGARLTVERVQGRRIMRVRIEALETTETTEGAGGAGRGDGSADDEAARSAALEVAADLVSRSEGASE
jgi:putative hemolysin